jgi:TPR repeat protein
MIRNRLLTALALALLIGAPVCVGAEVKFAKILAGSDARELSQWGRRYEHGEGVQRDLDRAVRLYCKAAAVGSAEAHYHLGWLYAIGRVGARDDALAAAWFYRAAEKNDQHAKRMLERLGYRGKPKQRAVCRLTDGGRADGAGHCCR